MIRRFFARLSGLLWYWPDRNIDWLQSIDVKYIERVAWLSSLTGLCLFVYAPLSDEPFLIYLMSAGAIVLGGVSWLGALQAKRAVDESD